MKWQSQNKSWHSVRVNSLKCLSGHYIQIFCWKIEDIRHLFFNIVFHVVSTREIHNYYILMYVYGTFFMYNLKINLQERHHLQTNRLFYIKTDSKYQSCFWHNLCYLYLNRKVYFGCCYNETMNKSPVPRKEPPQSVEPFFCT